MKINRQIVVFDADGKWRMGIQLALGARLLQAAADLDAVEGH